MGGKRLAKPGKGAMARQLVYFCIRFLAFTALWAMAMKTASVFTGCAVDLSDVLTFVGTVFGGELLCLLVKRLLAKPNENEEETL